MGCFYATRRSAELKCPKLELNVLKRIEPVTDRVNAEVTWSERDGRPGIGVRFVFSSERARLKMAKLIAAMRDNVARKYQR